MSLFAEIKRRNIYRAAAFYAGVAWLIVQIASQVFPFFENSNAVVRWIILVLGTAVVLLVLNQFVLQKMLIDPGIEVASIAVLPRANSTGNPARSATAMACRTFAPV